MGWVGLADDVDLAWRDTIMPFFRYYTERTPGSFIEEKEINVTWHYRNADPEFGEWQASELQMNLGKILAHMPISVCTGRRIIGEGSGRADRRAWGVGEVGRVGVQVPRGASRGRRQGHRRPDDPRRCVSLPCTP